MFERSQKPSRCLPLVLACFAALAYPACKPDITSSTYFCGPEGLCPPGLVCQVGTLDTFAYDCVTALSVEPFGCSQVTLDREPDDATDDAYALGTLQCGDQLTSTNWGCVPDGTDVDHFLVQTEGPCTGANPRFKASLRFPIGSAPLQLDLLDSEGTLIAASELCTADVDTTGTDSHCIEEPNLPPGEYYLRVSIDPAANADCGGECSFNRYQLFASSPII